MDREKQPYEVTARRGWQDEATPTLVHLEAPEGRFRRPAGAEYTISAETGLYDTEAKKLDLSGNVVLEQKDRFKARMDTRQHRGRGEKTGLGEPGGGNVSGPARSMRMACK